jgi:hypothetical protein
MYKTLIGLFLLFGLTCSLARQARAQTLSPTDSLILSKFRTELNLSPTQLHTIDSLYCLPLERIKQIDKEVTRISRTDIPQAEKDILFAALRNEKNSLKEDRSLAIQIMLNAEEQLIYATKITPVKPAVLHMGSNHDRASCNVCIKPK